MSRTASLCEGAQTSRINESSWRGCRAQWQRGASTALTGMRTGDKASPERTHPKVCTHPPRDERIGGMKRGGNTPPAPADLWPPPDGERQDFIDTQRLSARADTKWDTQIASTPWPGTVPAEASAAAHLPDQRRCALCGAISAASAISAQVAPLDLALMTARSS